ncbi:tetratricopeptide repeat protein [Novipirellula artificiosorum]|uniref:Anaphase-promoting complex, cyclosome, subunit 3 n=1 Tax=Novipirellula artificiosorum TaxID=2528016 RepID=A0A5C6D8Q0_9BACT|nr:hypothetical protein [Novipirellula artificiosorum]TWU32161.1 Anaphase-promoting complex, cyclosome, subunit 3 [Novipirellula artificiosorum]
MNVLHYLSPLRWARWMTQFIQAWSVSIPWQYAPQAIPALLLLVVLFVTGMVAYSDATSWRSSLMGRQFKTAWEVDDFATAELVLRRQLKERPEDTELMFRLGLARDAQDEREEASQIMRRLVVTRRNTKAARWLLQNVYLGGKWSDLDTQQQAELGRILKLVHEESPKDMQITNLYANFLLANERMEAAIPLLAELASVQPMQGLRAAAISRQLGQEGQAERLAEKTLELVSNLSAEEPTNASISLAVAQCQIFLNRHRDAVQTVNLAMSRAKTPEDLRTLKGAMGDAIVAYLLYREANPTKDEKQDELRSLQQLQLALQHAPNNPRVLSLVVDRVLAVANEDDEQIRKVRNALISGASPGIGHFIEGTSALVKGDNESGERHLKLAAEMLPNSGAILNNLAVAIATREGSDLEQALKISESAIEQTKDPSPHFYETRGQILAKLERYTKAIPDLERALAVDVLALGAHKALATCYDAIDEKEIADQHRQAAADREEADRKKKE